MKKLMVFLILMLGPIIVNASSISSIDMDIFVDDVGNARVREVWNADVDSGTEGWHPYYNLGNSTIQNLIVSMDGQQFTTISDWNVNADFSEKAYKAGFYWPSSNELDICFGITNYGSHIYQIEYTITGFVATMEDSDMIYWNLFPYDFSAEPEKVQITIYSDFAYRDVEFHGYGKYGATNELLDGRIVIDSQGSVGKDEYLTILVKFPKNTFQTSNVLENNFEHYYDMAEEGAINYSDKPKTFWQKVGSFLAGFFMIILNFGIWLVIMMGIFIASCNGKKFKCRFGHVGNKVRKDVPNYREIPCNKDIYRAYWVASNYGLIKKKEDFLGAILLKWLRNGNVFIEKIEKNGLFKNSSESTIVFVSSPQDNILLEKELYDWMVEASLDGKLESNEFKKWCQKNYTKILKWFDQVLDFESKMLVNEGKAVAHTDVKFKLLKFSYYDIDDSMMVEAEQLAGLKKFLKEFTLIKEREPIEVQLWDEYLMYAQIFGMADEVASQFKKLYPEVITDMDSRGFDYDDIVFIHMISYDGMKSANAAQSSSYSSGSGGGGSFGGGGGGGGFR